MVSTSVGRLFDAVSAILGIRRQSSFEGEASMALEFAAEAYEQHNLQKQKGIQDHLLYKEDGRLILNTQMLCRRSRKQSFREQTAEDWHICSIRHWQSRSQQPVWRHVM